MPNQKRYKMGRMNDEAENETNRPKEDSDLILKCFKTEFSNKILIDTLNRQENAQFAASSQVCRDRQTGVQDNLQSNYNIKNKYVDFLQEKIVELYASQARIENAVQKEDTSNIKMEFEMTKNEYLRVINKCIKLQRKTKQQKIKIMKMEELKLQAKQMRKALQLYAQSDSIPKAMLDVFELNEPSKLFDEVIFTQLTQNVPSQKMKSSALELELKNEQITVLKSQIQRINTEFDKLKEAIKVPSITLNEFEKATNKLKEEQNNVVQKIKETHKAQINEYELKLKAVENSKMMEVRKIAQLKKEQTKKVSELEHKLKESSSVIEKNKVECKSLESRLRMSEDKLEKMQREELRTKNLLEKEISSTQFEQRKHVIAYISEALRIFSNEGESIESKQECKPCHFNKEMLVQIEREFKLSSALTSNIKALETKIELQEIESKHLRSDLSTRNEEIEVIRDHYEQMSVKLRAKQEELLELKSQINQSEQRNIDLKNQIKANELELRNMNVLINEKENQIIQKANRAITSFEMQQTTIKQLNEKVEYLEKEIKRVSEQLTESESMKERLKIEFEDEKKKTMQEIEDRKIEKLKSISGNSITDKKILNELICDLKQKIEELTRENNGLTIDLAFYVKDYKEKSEIIEQSLEVLGKPREEIVVDKRDNEKVKKQKKEDMQVIERALEKIEQLEQLIENSRKENEENEKAARNTEEMNSKLKERIWELTSQERRNVNELIELRNFKEMNEALLGENKDLSQIKMSNYELRETNGKLRELNEVIERENAKLKKQSDENLIAIEALKDLKRVQHNNIKQEKANHQITLKREKQLEIEVKDLSALLSDAQEKVKTMMETKRNLESENESLKLKLSAMSNIDPRLSIQLRTYENEIKELIGQNGQSRSQVSKLAQEVRILMLENKKLIANQNDHSEKELLAEKDFEMMEMIKLSNAKQEELKECRKQLKVKELQNVELSRKLALTEETLNMQSKSHKSKEQQVTSKKEKRSLRSNRRVTRNDKEQKVVIERMEDEVNGILRKKNELESEVQKRNRELKEKSEVIREQSEALKMNANEINDLKRINNMQSLKVNSINCDLMIERERIINVTNELATLQQQCELLTNENAELQDTVIGNTEEFFNQLNELERKLQEATMQNEQLTTINTNLEIEKQEMSSKLASESLKIEGLTFKLEYMSRMNEKYSRLLKLPANFAEKLTNYDDFIDQFQDLKNENAEKNQVIERLEIEVEALRNRKEEKESEDLESSQFSAHVQAKAWKFATATEKVIQSSRKLKIEDNFKRNKSNENAKEAADANKLTKEERTINSLNQTIARKNEDYSKLREETNMLELRLKEQVKQNREIDLMRIELLESNRRLKEQERIYYIVNETDISKSNMATLKLLQEKEEYFNQIIEIYKSMNEKNSARNENQTQINEKEKSVELDQIQLKTELKLKAAMDYSKEVIIQNEAIRVEMAKVQLRLTESIKLEESKNMKIEELKSMNDELTRKIRIQETEIENMQIEAETFKKTEKSMNSEIELLKQLSEFSRESESEFFNKKLEIREAEINKLNETMKHHSACSSQIQSQKRTILNNEAEIQRIQSENAALKAQILNLNIEIGKWKFEMSERIALKQNLNIANAQLERQSEKIKLLENKNEVLKENLTFCLNNLDEACSEIHEEIHELLAETNSLIAKMNDK